MKMIQDRLLESGFQRNPWDPDPDYQQTMQDLYDAIAEALINNELVNEQTIDQAMNAENWMDSKLGEMVKELAQRLEQEGYLKPQGGDEQGDPNAPGQGGQGPDRDPGQVKFELTNKAIDFLGYRTLKDVLGGAGKSSIGAHDTKFQTTGVEAISESKPYEFGDTMNIDMGETFKNAAKHGLEDGKLQLDYGDLQVMQSEYHSSAATVVMLDCSHSMILYGEDRFTPAKQVALALAHMIHTQYRGDVIKFVLFHNGAEEIPLAKLAQAQVGAVPHEHRRRFAFSPKNPQTPKQRHEANRDDYRRQTVRHHPAERARLQKRLRPRPDGLGRNPARGRRLPPPGHPNQHVYAGEGPRTHRLCAARLADDAGQSLLHHAAHHRPVRAARLPVAAHEDGQLS